MEQTRPGADINLPAPRPALYAVDPGPVNRKFNLYLILVCPGPQYLMDIWRIFQLEIYLLERGGGEGSWELPAVVAVNRIKLA